MRGAEFLGWTRRADIGSANLADVAYGEGRYVVSSDSGLWTATDPTDDSWVAESIPAISVWGIEYGGGDWLLKGNNLGGYAYTSDVTGDSWSTATTGIGTYNNDYKYLNGGWIACVGAPAGNVVLTGRVGYASSVAGPWSVADVGFGGGGAVYSVAYGAGLYVAVGKSGKIATATTPGGTWTLRSSGTTQRLLDVEYGGGLFVATGDSGVVVTSPDGIDWTLRPSVSPTAGSSFDLVYDNGVWLRPGTDSGFPDWARMDYSTDPTSGWTRVYYGFGEGEYAYGVGVGPEFWVAVGSGGKVSTAVDPRVSSA